MRAVYIYVLLVAAIFATTSASAQMIPFAFWNQDSTPPAGCAGGGTPYGGYCYYFGGNFQSCDTVCAARGGCNLTGTSAYATNVATCAELADAIGEPYDLTNTNANGAGCYIRYHTIAGEPFTTLHRGSSATTCAAVPSGTGTKHRLCACVN
jgi:hypothetical protein